jgi:hypothetical protein
MKQSSMKVDEKQQQRIETAEFKFQGYLFVTF